jgi:hypothetical protein
MEDADSDKPTEDANPKKGKAKGTGRAKSKAKAKATAKKQTKRQLDDAHDGTAPVKSKKNQKGRSKASAKVDSAEADDHDDGDDDDDDDDDDDRHYDDEEDEDEDENEEESESADVISKKPATAKRKAKAKGKPKAKEQPDQAQGQPSQAKKPVSGVLEFADGTAVSLTYDPCCDYSSVGNFDVANMIKLLVNVLQHFNQNKMVTAAPQAGLSAAAVREKALIENYPQKRTMGVSTNIKDQARKKSFGNFILSKKAKACDVNLWILKYVAGIVVPSLTLLALIYTFNVSNLALFKYPGHETGQGWTYDSFLFASRPGSFQGGPWGSRGLGEARGS